MALLYIIPFKIDPGAVYSDGSAITAHDADQKRFLRQTMWVDLALVFGVLALIQWPGFARLIRGQILSIRGRNYVLAARALGMPTNRILTRNVIPNAMICS